MRAVFLNHQLICYSRLIGDCMKIKKAFTLASEGYLNLEL